MIVDCGSGGGCGAGPRVRHSKRRRMFDECDHAPLLNYHLAAAKSGQYFASMAPNVSQLVSCMPMQGVSHDVRLMSTCG